MKYLTKVEDKEYVVEILDDNHVRLGDQVYNVDFESISGEPAFSILVDGKSYEAMVYPDNSEWQVMIRGKLYIVQVEDEREKRLRAAAGATVTAGGEYHLKAPMPGLVISLPVENDQEVKKGDVLVILESMKMQNELKAPRDGIVKRVRVEPGDSVEQKQTLLSVE